MPKKRSFKDDETPAVAQVMLKLLEREETSRKEKEDLQRRFDECARECGDFKTIAEKMQAKVEELREELLVRPSPTEWEYARETITRLNEEVFSLTTEVNKQKRLNSQLKIKECCVCMEEQELFVMTCQHHLCGGCFENLEGVKKKKNPLTGNKEMTKKCPLCRQIVFLHKSFS
jgi:hypothetical protein